VSAAGRLTLTRRLADAAASGLSRLLCRVDAEELSKVPACGPLILVTNHVNFLEIPVLHTHLRPRPVVGLAKAEAWENPLLGRLFDLWGAIPVRRGEPDVRALRRSLAALEEGRILALAPEGTRSHDGRLQRGHSGVVTIALKSGAPLLPLVFYGGEAIQRNLARLRRTPFHVMVGRPFRVVVDGSRLTRDARQRVADEIMYQLSALLPPTYRGRYADLGAATEHYLRFLPAFEAEEAMPSGLDGNGRVAGR
jgi:1-acyl-sn-glycerol-3-phosphate acyltransferase